MTRSRKKSSGGPSKVSANEPSTSDGVKLTLFEGENLARLLNLICREVESAITLDAALPEKVWLKQQFAIGVNEVTRALERMPPVSSGNCCPDQIGKFNLRTHSGHLQAILLASDCNPRWLSKHLPGLANSRGVPVLYIKDDKRGSVRLGEVVKLKTAIAIGIKSTGNAINQVIQKAIDNKLYSAL